MQFEHDSKHIAVSESEQKIVQHPISVFTLKSRILFIFRPSIEVSCNPNCLLKKILFFYLRYLPNVIIHILTKDLFTPRTKHYK